MTCIEYAIEHRHHGENEIHEQLLRLAERHRAEHEVHYVARDLAAWSREHVQRIADAAERFGGKLSPNLYQPSGMVERVRAVTSNITARQPQSGVLLLEDLRALYLRASDNSLGWEMLAH